MRQRTATAAGPGELAEQRRETEALDTGGLNRLMSDFDEYSSRPAAFRREPRLRRSATGAHGDTPQLNEKLGAAKT
jgi:hypothetical protein